MSFYTSLTGLNSATAQLAVTSNNIANVGTSGFKRSRADFGDIFSTSPLQKSSSNIGQGVSLKQVSQEFSQGNISTSGNSLDLAITGDGFFPLRSADGLQEVFTRNGSFTLNDQNNVVNSTGQRLLAAAVDSSGKADMTNMKPLTIPPKTSGEAQETTSIQLGLNLPADATVITADFDRGNPTTYNKSTAMTVYDSGGNGYLATVYYAKTQNASPGSPYAKWQSYFYVGDTPVRPALQQATNGTGSALYVNRYGEIRPRSDPSVTPSSGTTEMYTLDQLTDVRSSLAADIKGNALSTDVFANGALTGYAAGDVMSFDMKVDGQTTYQTINYTMTASDADPATLSRNLEVAINNKMGTAAEARFGVGVNFDATSARFTFTSGTTGDLSSIQIRATAADGTASSENLLAQDLMGLPETLNTDASTGEAIRGKSSYPAQLTGEAITINTARSVSVIESNSSFLVTVDGISSRVKLPTGNYSIDDVARMLETKINGIVDPETGRQVLGVKVAFDQKSKQLTFTTGTTGSESSIQITGSADWGVANTEMRFGETTQWIKLAQYTSSGALQYVNNGVQTEDAAALSTKTEWWPVYLDRGELTFDLTGQIVSPNTPMGFETAFLAGGKGALTMNIDFTQSTQYSSSFAVLSQAQDGKPEGELMGLDIGVDGLVNATYSNGSQNSLGKIVLANFSSPTGLRQVGDASYLASATSGSAKIGEAGSAGFGSIRAGATERANVDLTQELVDLITAQRNFQANAKAIETSSTMTSAIINIRA